MKRKNVFIVALLMSIACLVSCGEKEPIPEELKDPEIFEYTYRSLQIGEPIPIKGKNLEGVES